MSNQKLMVLIVEDEPLIAEGIKLHLSGSSFVVSCMAYDPDDAIQAIQSNDLDIAILDINLEADKDGIDIAKYILANNPFPFIYLTSYSDSHTMERAKETSPAGFIVKPFNKKTLLATLEIAVNNFAQHNKQHVPDLSVGKINQQIASPLSEREFELLQLIYEGKNNKEICDLLFIAMNTVKRHVTNIYFKLDVKSRTEAIKIARNLMLK
ncbi:MAG: response regulator transcription factor [Chitinophagaceae bacterium]|nr:response regulator transcription factor [Chitinophagaceae bacterium]MBK8608151.1 response regulator transcription factor [Chitinophagaceae bacterium]MBP6478507.1 response regulator transcription factor [Chitinophagaceae bacterium]MBP7107310.1 response regulator transcription factor [Chitinophagaceae bacterium]MBP7315959.1 response regulator transcription factor [Chitinophagaceae bacterium]